MSRPPEVRVFGGGLIIDSFACGGGTSTGIEMALGRSPTSRSTTTRARSRCTRRTTRHEALHLERVGRGSARGDAGPRGRSLLALARLHLPLEGAWRPTASRSQPRAPRARPSVARLPLGEGPRGSEAEGDRDGERRGNRRLGPDGRPTASRARCARASPSGASWRCSRTSATAWTGGCWWRPTTARRPPGSGSSSSPARTACRSCGPRPRTRRAARAASRRGARPPSASTSRIPASRSSVARGRWR
jgi:hypothetical protein